jgi:transcriptional regulator with XRE-family HTH domain
MPGSPPEHTSQLHAGATRAKEAGLRLGQLHPGKKPGHPHELGDFPKARRAQLRPQEVGLPGQGPVRKVAGLRREEVAQLAAIRVHYVTRLEQGRVQASASVLMTLARALRLDDDQDAYPYEFVGKTPARSRRRRLTSRRRTGKWMQIIRPRVRGISSSNARRAGSGPGRSPGG